MEKKNTFGKSVRWSPASMTTRAREVPVWPSERIPPGGAFHTPKFEYSKETSDLLKLLMQEAKMSMLLRKKVNDHLHNGDPLPKAAVPCKLRSQSAAVAESLIRSQRSKRKGLSEILASGAYEITPYRPQPNASMPTEKAKQQLQEAMSGLPMSSTTLNAARRARALNKRTAADHVTTRDIINELLDQINERAEWLKEMEALGEGRKFRDEMRAQIAERLRRIKALEAKSARRQQSARCH